MLNFVFFFHVSKEFLVNFEWNYDFKIFIFHPKRVLNWPMGLLHPRFITLGVSIEIKLVNILRMSIVKTRNPRKP